MSDISPPSQDSPETAPSRQKRLDVFAAADRLWQGDLLPQTGFLHGRVQVKTHRQREAEGREEQEQSAPCGKGTQQQPGKEAPVGTVCLGIRPETLDFRDSCEPLLSAGPTSALTHLRDSHAFTKPLTGGLYHLPVSSLVTVCGESTCPGTSLPSPFAL